MYEIISSRWPFALLIKRNGEKFDVSKLIVGNKLLDETSITLLFQVVKELILFVFF